MVGLSCFFAYLLPDPEHSSVVRSLLAFGYVAASLTWLRANRRARRVSTTSFALWWLLGAVLLFVLAINKLVDLRTQFELGFRVLAKSGNWYERRQPLQFVLAIVLPSLLALFGGLLLVTKARAFACSHRLAMMGWLLLFLYLALRESQEWKPALALLTSLRYRDWRLALELAGILLVTIAALKADSPVSSQTYRCG